MITRARRAIVVLGLSVDVRSNISVNARCGDVILFLGSRVSLASGLPSVKQVNTKLQLAAERTRVKQLMLLLEQIDKDYVLNSAWYKKSGRTFGKTGQIYRTDTTYEDLYFLAEKISLSGMGLASDATAGAFADLVRQKGRNFLVGRSKIERSIDLAKLAGETARFVEKTVASMLYSTTICGLDLILALAAELSS